MSRSGGRRGTSAAEAMQNEVLLRLARELGPGLDVVDVDVARDSCKPVRDLVRELADVGTPAAVRVALLDLIEAGLLARGAYPGRDHDGELIENVASVRLRQRGLLAARELEPDCGKPTTRIRIVGRRRRMPFDVRVDTEQRERDSKLNKSPTAVACLLVLLVREPRQGSPLLVQQLIEVFQRLARVGYRRPGPGAELAPSAESLRKAMQLCRSVLSLKMAPQSGDQRRDSFYLDGCLPEIEVVPVKGALFGDWQSLRAQLWAVIEDKPAPWLERKLRAPEPCEVTRADATSPTG